MSQKLTALVLTSLLVSGALADLSQDPSYTTSAGDVNWTTENGPYGLSGTFVQDQLTNHAVATHKFAATGPPNANGSYSYTVTVADLPLNSVKKYENQTKSVANAAVSLSGPAVGAEWELCHTFVVPDYNQTWVDLFDPEDNGDCSTAFSDECLSKLGDFSCLDTPSWPDECPSTSSIGSYGWNDTASMTLKADAFVNYYSSPYDASNKTIAENMARQVFPILVEWKNSKTSQSVRGVHCVRADVTKAATPTVGSTAGATGVSSPSSTPSNTAGLRIVVKKEYLFGVVAMIAGYMTML